MAARELLGPRFAITRAAVGCLLRVEDPNLGAGRETEAWLGVVGGVGGKTKVGPRVKAFRALSPRDAGPSVPGPWARNVRTKRQRAAASRHLPQKPGRCGGVPAAGEMQLASGRVRGHGIVPLMARVDRWFWLRFVLILPSVLTILFVFE